MKNQCPSWEKRGLRANSTWCLSLSFPNILKVLKHHRGHDQKPYNTFLKKPVAKMLTIITIFFSQSIAFEFYTNLFKANFIKFPCPWATNYFGVGAVFYAGIGSLCAHQSPCMRNFVFCQLLNNICSSNLGHWQIFQSENGSWTPFP